MDVFVVIVMGLLATYAVLSVILKPYSTGLKPVLYHTKLYVPIEDVSEFINTYKMQGFMGLERVIENPEPDIYIIKFIDRSENLTVSSERYRRIGGTEETPILHLEQRGRKIEPLGSCHYIVEYITENKGHSIFAVEERAHYSSTFVFILEYFHKLRLLQKVKKQSSNPDASNSIPTKKPAGIKKFTNAQFYTRNSARSAHQAPGSKGFRVKRKGSISTDYTQEIVISCFAMVSFTIYFGWQATILLAPMILLHEYGHLLGYQLTGKTGNRMMLIPFFGGVAVAGGAHRTEFERAFCALMGPAICVPLSIVLTAAAFWVGNHWTGWWLAYGAIICAVGNAINLAPIYPLDGGHILESIARSIAPSQAQAAMIAVTLGGAGMLYTAGYTGIAMFAAFIGLPSLLNSSGYSGLTPLDGKSGGLIALGYLITLGAHLICAFLIYREYY